MRVLVIALDEDEDQPLVDENGNNLVSDQEEVPQSHAEDFLEHAEEVSEVPVSRAFVDIRQ